MAVGDHNGRKHYVNADLSTARAVAPLGKQSVPPQPQAEPPLKACNRGSS